MSGSGGYDKVERASALLANSQITLKANGGDPQIAAAITDFTPNTQNSILFRADIQAWLRTIPTFPRMVEQVPTLMPIADIIPVVSENYDSMTDEEKHKDSFGWLMRQRSMRQALRVVI